MKSSKQMFEIKLQADFFLVNFIIENYYRFLTHIG